MTSSAKVLGANSCHRGIGILMHLLCLSEASTADAIDAAVRHSYEVKGCSAWTGRVSWD